MVVIKQGVPPGPYPDPAAAIAAKAVTINYGVFILTVVSFIIIALVVFFFIVRPVAKMTAPKVAPCSRRSNDERLPLLRYRDSNQSQPLS